MRSLADINSVNFRVVHDYPPNIKRIAEVLPGAYKPGVIFTYGDTVYSPTVTDIRKELLAHEAVHVAQQADTGKDEWWDLYLKDTNFRMLQELEAHRVEYQMLAKMGYGRPYRRRYLQVIAKRLSGPLYGNVISTAKAKEAIRG